ncbi:50S ribosomal protein L34 [Tolypocladium capitatum]|uniref:50S ribosomal protein L34 n=1 Tax=Tolypocladium capitatum TaxID=45235 RepID=A0A2K3QPT3_9HYPO|nr:50S ribosomal protein L34 [Tolypocladium capitatum]
MQSLARLARPLLAKPLSSGPRSFTTLSPLRPSLTPTRRPGCMAGFTPTPTTTTTAAADVVPTGAVSSHPALSGLQLRFGPRNTMNGHTRLVQKRRHGFLYRMRSKTGRRIILRRKMKGRRHVAW